MNMKILLLAIYPAPYRVELIKKISEFFSADAFFEFSLGDERAAEWFSAENLFLLDTVEGKERYKSALKRISEYNLVVLYDYATRRGIELIFHCIKNRVPYVVNSDGAMLTSHGNFLKDGIKRVLLSRVTACLASGKNAEQYFKQYGVAQNKIYHHTFSTLERDEITNKPISIDEKVAYRTKLGLPCSKRIVIAVGRFIPLKRYLELIQSWTEMPEDCVLLLIGGGKEETKYKRFIIDNNLKNVIIEGFHPKKELFEYYKAADLFVHPTSYDVWGLVVNEAMACGLPVVVSDYCVAGLELIRNGENGYLISMGNDKEMSDRVLEILNDEELRNRMSKNAIQIIRPYTIEHMAETHIQVFKEIFSAG